jgi:hypothetical protein
MLMRKRAARGRIRRRYLIGVPKLRAVLRHTRRRGRL